MIAFKQFFKHTFYDFLPGEVAAIGLNIWFYFKQPTAREPFSTTLLLRGKFNANLLYDIIASSVWIFAVILAWNLALATFDPVQRWVKALFIKLLKPDSNKVTNQHVKKRNK